MTCRMFARLPKLLTAPYASGALRAWERPAMTDATIAAALLNFAGASGFNTMLIGRKKLSPLTNKLFWLLAIGGVIAIALALLLFVSEQGLQYGIVYWGVSGLVCSFIVIFFLTGKADGLRSILAVIAFGVGIYYARRSGII
jgi:hypothetical protein